MLWADTTGQQDAARATLAMGTLFGVALLEQFLPAMDQGVRGDRSRWGDLAHMAANGFAEVATRALILVPVVALAPTLHGALGFSLWPDTWPYALQCALALLVVDGFDYWAHRALHGISWLWPIHAVHHDIDRLHVLKSPRSNFLTNIVRFSLAYVPFVVLGGPVEMVFWFQALLISVGSIAHTNLDLRFPAHAHRLFVTPAVHRLHHARAGDHRDRNFAAMFPIWDWVFGTYEQPVDGVAPSIGVDSGGVPDGFWRQSVWPFLCWSRVWSKALSSSIPESSAAANNPRR
jgi:sterol desaturase/sphingolipid hydroxylase (fatty acid hydroxylase superfamily)